MNRRLASLLLAWLLAGTAVADSSTWVSQPGSGDLRFLPSYEGEQIEGRFSDFAVTLRLSEPGDEPESLSVRVTVGSADMQDDEVNQELLEPEWFDAGTHPSARFTSERIQKRGDGYVASGTLELRGVRKPLELPFALQSGVGQFTLNGQVEIERSRWGVGGGEWAEDAALAERVEVRYRVVLERSEAR